MSSIVRRFAFAALGVGAVACGMKSLTSPAWVRAHEPIAELGDGDCILSHEGRLACASEYKARPLRQLQERIVQLESNGGSARCAVLQSGRLACWGCLFTPPYGDLGQREIRYERPAALRSIDLPPVREIAIAGGGMCALTRTGEVSCWGFRGYDGMALCNGPSRSDPRTVAQGVSQIAVDRNGTLCRLDKANVLRCSSVFYESKELTLRGVKRVTAGMNHFCALTQAGAVICWGDNESAQCAAPSTACEPDQPGGYVVNQCLVQPHNVALPEPAIDVTAGPSHSCAALRSGRVFCWGSSANGALGFASVTRCPASEMGFCAIEPQPVAGILDATRVRARKTWGVQTWALLSDGSAVVWPSDEKRP